MNEEAQQNKTVEAKKPSFLQSVFATIKKYVNDDTPAYLKEAKKYARKYEKLIEDDKNDIAAARERKYKENKYTEYLRNELEETPTGRQCLKMLDESGYQICYESMYEGFVGKSEYLDPGQVYAICSAIDPENKRIILNSQLRGSTGKGCLSLVNAACFLKQELDGAGNSPEVLAIRKADALLTQHQFLNEQDWNRMEFDEHYSANMSDVYKIASDVEKLRYDHNTAEYAGRPKSDIKDRARSACIDFFLDDVLGEKVPSAETIANVCRDFNGISYYKSDNWFSRDGKKEMDAARKAEKWSRYYRQKPTVYVEKTVRENIDRSRPVKNVLDSRGVSHQARMAEQKERLIQQKAIQLAKMKQGGR